MKRIALIAFILVSLGELFSTLTGNELVHMICKPAIMITLLIYYLTSSREDGVSSVKGAIVFSFFGDVLLMGSDYFIYGLLAFLVSHILYIVAYRQHRDEEGDRSLTGIHRIRLAFPVILAGTGLVVILFPVLDEMKLPVMVYAFVITFMVLSALFRLNRTNATSFWLVFLGASLFMISDSVLAINKFLQPVGLASFWIMLTYITAQFFIIEGLLKHNVSHK